MYTGLACTLCVFAVLSVIVYVLQSFFTAINYQDTLWQVWWIFDAYWEYLYIFITLMIAFLWRPNANNERFEYTPMMTEDKESENNDDILLL